MRSLEENDPTSEISQLPTSANSYSEIRFLKKIPRVRNIKDPVANYGLNGLNYLKANPAWKL